MPFLLYPLALVALVAVPALAAIYIFRNRFRRRQVSSLMLWRFRLQTKQGGAKVHRLQLPLIFFLELLALLLLVAAATGPQWKLSQSTRPLVVILDDSFSMRAADGNVSAKDRAQTFLEKLFRSQSPPSTRLILAGTEPRLLGASVKTWTEVDGLLDQWECWSLSTSMDRAITLASELGKQQANILVLTDHPPDDENITGDRLQWHSFGRPVENVAVVNASRAAHGDEDRCLLEVANLSASTRNTRMIVRTGTNSIQSANLSLGARERQRLVFNVPSSAALLRATLDADSLNEDNEVQLLPPIRKKVRVQVLLTNAALSDLVSRTLDSTGLRAAITENPELVIHQSASVPAGSNAWSLRWIQSSQATAYSGPFVIDTGHPLAQGVALNGVVWAAANATNSPSEVPVILAGNIPLLSVRDDALGRRHLTLNLSTTISTAHTTPDWPILFWNVLQWRASQTPGLLESNARLGSEVTLKTAGAAALVTWPDGTQKSFPTTGDQLALETPMPGLYSVVLGQSTNSFAVNPLAAEESDLSQCRSGKWGQWSEGDERRLEEASILWAIALAALVVLATHLFLLATGKGDAR